jgi:neural Wiskott-Aldrich syndrome protein
MTTTITDELARIPMSPFLTATLKRAADYATAQLHREVTLEHLLLALAEDPEASVVLKSSNVDIARLLSDVSGFLGASDDRVTLDSGHSVAISDDLRRILEAAAAAAQQGRRREINGAIVLAAIVGDGRSAAANLLRTQGLTFEEAIRALQRATTAPPPEAVPSTSVPETSRVPGTPAPDPAVSQTHAPAARQVKDSSRLVERPSSTEEILASARERIQSRARLPREEPVPDVAAKSEPDTGNVEGGSHFGTAAGGHAGSAPEEMDDSLDDILEPELAAEAPAEPSATPPNPAAVVTAPEAQPPQPHEAVPNDTWVPPVQRGPVAEPQGSQPPIPGRQGPAPHIPPSQIPPSQVPPSQGRPVAPQLPMGGAAPMPPRPPPLPPLAPAPQVGGGGAGYPPHAHPQQVPVPAGVTPQGRRPQRRAPDSQNSERHRAGAGGIIGGWPLVEAGQLVESIPRRMRAGVPIVVEARIARADVKALADGIQGGGAAYRHEVMVTKAMSVRLRAPEGGFWIENRSPETQWIENVLGLPADDFASWRWTVTPRERGKKQLQLIVSARTVATDGLTAETALPDQVIDVKVGVNYARTFGRWSGWAAAAVAGGLFARFGDGLFEHGREVVARLMSGG